MTSGKEEKFNAWGRREGEREGGEREGGREREREGGEREGGGEREREREGGEREGGREREREREGREGEREREREREGRDIFLTMFEYSFTEQSLPHLYDLRPCSVRGRLVQSPLDKPTPTTTVLVGMQVDTVITVGVWSNGCGHRELMYIM